MPCRIYCRRKIQLMQICMASYIDIISYFRTVSACLPIWQHIVYYIEKTAFEVLQLYWSFNATGLRTPMNIAVVVKSTIIQQSRFPIYSLKLVFKLLYLHLKMNEIVKIWTVESTKVINIKKFELECSLSISDRPRPSSRVSNRFHGYQCRKPSIDFYENQYEIKDKFPQT